MERLFCLASTDGASASRVTAKYTLTRPRASTNVVALRRIEPALATVIQWMGAFSSIAIFMLALSRGLPVASATQTAKFD